MAVSTIQSVSFPFRKGPTGFPEPVKGARAVVENVFSLLMTARSELPMGNNIGVDVYTYVGETTGPLLQARVAQNVRSVIRANEPRMRVLAVTTREEITRDGTKIVAAVEYDVAGEQGQLGIPVGDVGGFTST